MEIARLATWAMGSRFEVVLAGPERRVRPAGEAAIEAIEEQDRRLSLFRRESLLSHLNARAADRPVRLDAELFDLLETSRGIHAASEGAFDVSVASLMADWGFHPSRRAGTGRGTSGMQDVRLDPAARTVRFARPGLAIDLGAIGKGHALDLAAERLREAGVGCALLHGGTSAVVALGSPLGAAGWRVRIRSGTEAPDLVATLRDRALCVSAPRGRTIEREGSALGHVLDPRSGSPAAGIATAAALTGSARLADAWSTALLVLGRRPRGAPGDLTSAILPEGAREWRIEGPDRLALAPSGLNGGAAA